MASEEIKTLASKVAEVIGVKKDTLIFSVNPTSDEIAEGICEALKNEREVQYMNFNDFYVENNGHFKNVIKDFLETPFENFVFVADVTKEYEDIRFFDISHYIGRETRVKFKDKKDEFKGKKFVWVSLENKQKEWRGHFDAVLWAH